MKKQLFALATIVATVLFASCSKDNNENGAPSGEKAKLTIGIKTVESRALGSLTAETDNAVTQFTAYVFADEVFQAKGVSTTGAGITLESGVTTSANSVYMIANANTALAGFTPANKTALLSKLGDLLSSGALNIMTGGKVWSSGSATIAAADYTGADNTASVSVTMVPVASRINLTVDDQRTGTGTAGAWELTRVQMFNVPATTPYIKPAAFATPAVWYSAYANTHEISTVAAYYNDAYDATGKKHLFYTFENDATVRPTIISLVASNDGGTTLRYFPVHFSIADKGTLVRGKSYNVTIKLSGSATTEEPGTDDPEDEIIPANIDVTVEVDPWDVVDIEKIFN